jgi:hypothetical protein
MATVLRDPGGVALGAMSGWVRGVGTFSSAIDPAGAVGILDFDSTLNTMHVRFSTNRTTFTAIGSVSAAGDYSSMAIDSSNNVHLAYHRVSPYQVRYLRLTYAGGQTWTQGSEEIVYTSPTGWVLGRRDIDVLDSGVVVITAMEQNASALLTRVHVFVRNTSGSWVQTTIATSGASGNYTRDHMLSICRDPNGSSAGVQRISVIYALNNSSDGQLDIFPVTLSSGALGTRFSVHDNPAGVAGTFGSACLFATGPNETTLGTYSGGSVGAMKFHGTTGGITTPRVTSTFTFTPQAGNPSPTFAFLNDRLVVLGRQSRSGQIITGSKICDLRTPGVATWHTETTSTFIPPHQGSTTSSLTSAVDFVWSGSNRNFTLNRLDVIAGRSAGGRVLHEYNRPIPAPTGISPGASSIVSTDRPQLRATIDAPSGTLTAAQRAQMPAGNWLQFRRKGRWNLARDGAFSLSLRTVVEPETDLRSSGVADEYPDGASELFQSSWYIQAAAEDELGVRSPYSTTTTFEVSHPPTVTSLNPDGGKAVIWSLAGTVLTFIPTDPSPTDAMTAYQVQVLNLDGSLVVDTGKVARVAALGEVTSVTVPIPVGSKDLTLNWKVKTWDTDDVAGEYSPSASFRATDPPVVTILQPTNNGTVDTPAPTTLWTTALTGGRSQASRRVYFTQTHALIADDPEDPTSSTTLTAINPTIVHDSGRAASSSTIYSPPQSILVNGAKYIVTVEVSDTVGLEARASITFTVEYIPPSSPVFTVDVNAYGSLGYVSVGWTNAETDPDFYSWRVYSREVGTSRWILRAEESEVASSYQFRDWLIGANVPQQWVVAQVATRFGVLVESLYFPVGGTPISEDYWLIDQFDEVVNVRLPIVTADDFTDEYEQETINLLGRGRIVEFGTHWGYTGKLQAQVRDTSFGTARVHRMKLEYLKSLRRAVYLRNPFGDVWEVVPGDIQVARLAGVGQREFVDVTIPYQEIGSRELPTVEYIGGPVAGVTREEVEQMVAGEAQARAEALANLTTTVSSTVSSALASHSNEISPHSTAKFVKAKGVSDQFGIFNQATDPGSAADPNDLWAQ